MCEHVNPMSIHVDPYGSNSPGGGVNPPLKILGEGWDFDAPAFGCIVVRGEVENLQYGVVADAEHDFIVDVADGDPGDVTFALNASIAIPIVVGERLEFGLEDIGDRDGTFTVGHFSFLGFGFSILRV